MIEVDGTYNPEEHINSIKSYLNFLTKLRKIIDDIEQAIEERESALKYLTTQT